MAFQTIPNTFFEYGLISYTADGIERPEETGIMSQRLINKARDEKITNVFFFCHGWKGDEPAARLQYESWIKAFATSEDANLAPQTFPNYKPMYIGLHWPSLPFGDEELTGGFGAAAGPESLTALTDTYLARLGNTDDIKGPLTTIINEARRNAAPQQLPENIKSAYLALNDALGLKSEGVDASPDADREAFDPQKAFEGGSVGGASFGGGINLGGILGPLRQLSYWTMKKRARTIGEGGMHNFLKELMYATADQKARIHLMGHSFGTIVISSMIGGPNAQGNLPRPVDSVALVQGAVSLWCYAPDIPFRELIRKTGPGYFNRILQDGRVSGPLVTTSSKWDKAVGVLYPWASRIHGSPSFAGNLPKFGAIGAFGIQGLPDDIRSESEMLDAKTAYQFEKKKIYNLNGSKYISHMEPISGAHSDIAGPEVAHAIWASALASA